MSNRHDTASLVGRISLNAAILLVVANMVGTGIFTTSGFILAELNNSQALLLCWAVGALFALSGALCYAELGALLPRAGGEYAYLRASFGELPAFLAGWISILVGFSAPIAAAAIAFSVYFLGGGEQEVYWQYALFAGIELTVKPVVLLAATAVIVLSAVHILSLRVGIGLQSWLTAFKIAILLALLVAGLFSGAGSVERLGSAIAGEPQAKWNSSSFAVALIFVSFAYSGWNAASYLGSEIHNPERNLPRALITGTLLVSLLYLLLNLLFIYLLPPEQMSGALDVATLVAEQIFGSGFARFFGLAIAFGLLSVVSAMILTGPRVYYAMAQDGLMLKLLAKTGNGNKTPVAAIVFQALLALVMIFTTTFETLLIYIGFLLSLSSMLTVLGLIKLRRSQPDAPRPYSTLGYPWTPLFFILGNAWIIVYALSERPAIAMYGLATLGLIVLIWRVFGVRGRVGGGNPKEKEHRF